MTRWRNTTREKFTVVAGADSKEPTVLLGGVADSDGTVPLEVGDNEIAVKVVAEDATSTATYVINVMRAKPGVSISAVETEVAEGDVIEFLINRNTAASEPLDVGVEYGVRFTGASSKSGH